MEYSPDNSNEKLEYENTQTAGVNIASDAYRAERRWSARLLRLDEETQRKIACKYYGGHMPWKDTSIKH
ncbi:MAG: hypothetical protein WCQ72_05330 [Eubacteriales bacterium]